MPETFMSYMNEKYMPWSDPPHVYREFDDFIVQLETPATMEL